MSPIKRRQDGSWSLLNRRPDSSLSFLPNRRPGRWLCGWLGVAALLLGGCDQSRSPTGPDASRVALAPLVVQQGALDDRMVLTGEIEAINAENLLVPRTPAWMLALSWLAEDGTVVKKGDKVVEFDSSALAETLQDKRAALLRADNELASELAKASADLADRVMQVERARADLEKKDIEAGVPADLEAGRQHQEKQLILLSMRDALAKAQAELTAQKRTSQLDRSVREVDRARAARELNELEKRLDELTLRATRDGMVQLAVNPSTGRKYLVGDQTYAGTTVASLPDLATMQVHARLSDVDDGAVRAGMAAESILDAYPQVRFTGTVQSVSLMARSTGRDAARRFFDVLVAFDKAASSVMRPGMSVRVEVIRRRAASALVVPRAALRRGPGKSQVRRLGGELIPVEVDFCSELACAVRGLTAGTILAPATTLEKGS